MSNRRYETQFMHSFSRKPVRLGCKFQVSSGNGAGVVAVAPPTQPAGFGQPNPSNLLFGKGISSVLGYSTAPAAGNNMAQGNIQITLQDNYYAFLGWSWDVIETVTGSAVNVTTGLTLGKIYQIVTVGTTTTAGWQFLGVPAGITPAPGVAFVAATASVGTGTGTVKAVGNAGVPYGLELAGDPNLTINPVGQTQGFGGGPAGYLLLQCWKPTDSATTTAVLAQPADNTIFNLNLFLEGA